MTTKTQAIDRLVDAIAGSDVAVNGTIAQGIDALADTLAGSDVATSGTIAQRIEQIASYIEDGTIVIGGGGGGGMPSEWLVPVKTDYTIAGSSYGELCGIAFYDSSKSTCMIPIPESSNTLSQPSSAKVYLKDGTASSTTIASSGGVTWYDSDDDALWVYGLWCTVATSGIQKSDIDYIEIKHA